MVCPLFKKIKSNGTTFYAFPGAAEDISAAYQNQNYRMYFSKYVLLNLPKENLIDLGGSQSSNMQFDFGSFSTIAPSLATEYKDRIVESLRNYVANHEVSLRESRLNNTEYYYDTTALETTSEKIFWKWCKKLNLIDFDPAVPQDEYLDNLSEFQRVNQTDDSYFPEYLWEERKTTQFDVIDYFDTTSLNFTNLLELKTSATTNIRVNDVINLTDFTGDLTIDVFGGSDWLGTASVRVLEITTQIDGTQNIVVDFPSTLASNPSLNVGKISLKYNKLVQYIGEVNGVSNVQEANKAYTEVYAHIPDHTGQTPDILFRTLPDVNYRPSLEFPIIPNQYQPEIIGADLFSSPIVSNPTEYPGSYYGQFDTIDFTYVVEDGDSLRRSGNFYGVNGDINDPVYNGSTIDGVIVDFNTSHYAKMNIVNREVSNFDQFNALEVSHKPPKDFEFNAILWYYTVEDLNGNKKSNLYGISFLDNPDNSTKPEEVSVRFPVYKKLVTNGSQDGTSYAFGLNLNFNIIHDNPQEAYNPQAINSLFSMNLFNSAMAKLSSLNDSFLNILSQQNALQSELQDVKQLLYSQTDLNTINSKISNLESLLKLYSTQQIVSSDTIQAEFTTSSPSQLKLNNIDKNYYSIQSYNTSDMYNLNGSIPVAITPPNNKNFLVNIINNDEVSVTLPNSDKLVLNFTTDLSYKQTADILINGGNLSTQNKKLDIFITTINPVTTSSTSSSVDNFGNIIPSSLILTPPVETLIIGDIDLPVLFNPNTSQPNSASTWKGFNFPIDFNQNISLIPGHLLQMSLDSNSLIIANSIKKGDALVMNNLFVGTVSVFDFSGQYNVDSVTGNIINLDITSNPQFVSYYDSFTLTLPTLHNPSGLTTMLSNSPFISLNKGYLIKITRISPTDNITLSEKYNIDIRNLEY